MNNDQQSPEPVSTENKDHDDTISEHVRSQSTWLRLFFMIVVAFLLGVSRIVVAAVIVLQFFWVLFTGATNPNLARLGQSLATYTYQVILYLAFNTEERPFPFDADWPSGPPKTGV